MQLFYVTVLFTFTKKGNMTLSFQLYKSTFPTNNTYLVGLGGAGLKITFYCHTPTDVFKEDFVLPLLHQSKVADGCFLQVCVKI